MNHWPSDRQSRAVPALTSYGVGWRIPIGTMNQQTALSTAILP